MVNERDDASETPDIDPGLHWRIKDSFVKYVLRGAGGAYSVTDGADDDGAGTFFFPFASASRGDGGWVLSFGGDVRFSGHHGALFVPFTEPVIRLGETGGTLAIRRTVPEGSPADTERIVIAELTGEVPQRLGDALAWPAVTAQLTPAGVSLLGDAYPVGTLMDPLRMLIPAQ
ncbi:HtaA domain-containing protein [Microbacterium sp. A82]|uniref:HtaA domain-containing protein n=1 Tax=Microbacterium sp. A82 TaxID=3450452 RepID=UPI003F415ED3